LSGRRRAHAGRARPARPGTRRRPPLAPGGRWTCWSTCLGTDGPWPSVVLAGSPGVGALLGLARLAAARGDDDAANDLQARAAAMAARDPPPRPPPRGRGAD